MEIFPFYSDGKQYLCTAITMAMMNKLQIPGSKLSSELNTVHNPVENRAEVIDLIKILNDLKTAGAISETDFEKKKNELLSRL
jgi:hypothetical protein